MNENCLGKYQNNKWSYMCMFNFFLGQMKIFFGDLLFLVVDDICEFFVEIDFC